MIPGSRCLQCFQMAPKLPAHVAYSTRHCQKIALPVYECGIESKVNRSLEKTIITYHSSYSSGSFKTRFTIRAPYAGGFEITARDNFSNCDWTRSATSADLPTNDKLPHRSPIFNLMHTVHQCFTKHEKSGAQRNSYRRDQNSLQMIEQWSIPCCGIRSI